MSRTAARTVCERELKRERIRRKKKRILIKKIRRFFIRLLILAVLAVCAWKLAGFLLETSIFGGTNQEIEKPISRTDDEVREKFEGLAADDKEYEDIIENYDDYPAVWLAALANNPEMLDFVKGYPDREENKIGELTKKEMKQDYPLFLQWDERWGYASYGENCIGISGCGPTALAMAAFALTRDERVTPVAVARYAVSGGYYVEGTGTSWSLMTEGAQSFGITGSELSLDESVMARELKDGHPIICAMRPGDFTAQGHFILIYDYDEKDGFSVNDPNCRARSERKWTFEELRYQIKNLWSFQKSE